MDKGFSGWGSGPSNSTLSGYNFPSLTPTSSEFFDDKEKRQSYFMGPSGLMPAPDTDAEAPSTSFSGPSPTLPPPHGQSLGSPPLGYGMMSGPAYDPYSMSSLMSHLPMAPPLGAPPPARYASGPLANIEPSHVFPMDFGGPLSTIGFSSLSQSVFSPDMQSTSDSDPQHSHSHEDGQTASFYSPPFAYPVDEDDDWADRRMAPTLSAEAKVFVPPSLLSASGGDPFYGVEGDGEGDYLYDDGEGYEGDMYVTYEEDGFDDYEYSPDEEEEAAAADYAYAFPPIAPAPTYPSYANVAAARSHGATPAPPPAPVPHSSPPSSPNTVALASSLAHGPPIGSAALPSAARRAPLPAPAPRSEGYSPAAPERRLCPFFLQDSCKYGAGCKDSHDMGTICALCKQVFCQPHECSTETSAAHMDVCPEMSVVRREKARSVDHACNLCGQNPLDRNERYGILTSCSHAFCLSCIKEHRRSDNGCEKDNARKCPVCRVTSHYVIPCDRFISDSERKEKLISQFQQSLSTIPCAKFNRGKGACPFGSSCFYAHLDENGNAVEPQRPRLGFSAAEGEVKVLNDGKLSDLFDWGSGNFKKLKTKKKK